MEWIAASIFSLMAPIVDLISAWAVLMSSRMDLVLASSFLGWLSSFLLVLLGRLFYRPLFRPAFVLSWLLFLGPLFYLRLPFLALLSAFPLFVPFLSKGAVTMRYTLKSNNLSNPTTS
jgi:hypothetical protein